MCLQHFRLRTIHVLFVGRKNRARALSFVDVIVVVIIVIVDEDVYKEPRGRRFYSESAPPRKLCTSLGIFGEFTSREIPTAAINVSTLAYSVFGGRQRVRARQLPVLFPQTLLCRNTSSAVGPLGFRKAHKLQHVFSPIVFLIFCRKIPAILHCRSIFKHSCQVIVHVSCRDIFQKIININKM